MWQTPGWADELLQERVSRDEGCLSTEGSGLLLDRVAVAGGELLAGGDPSGSDPMLTEVLPDKGFI